MRKSILIFLMVVASVSLISNFSWGQCPEDPEDAGLCDTLHVVPYKADMDSIPPFVQVESFPAFVEVLLLVTHDIVVDSLDSLVGFVIPLEYVHSNPAAYCSVGAHWNTTAALYVSPHFGRSIFRHLVEDTDTLMHNRMAHLADDFGGREWDTRDLALASDSMWYDWAHGPSWVPPHAWMSLIATGTADQRWWEGNRQLLATLTFNIEDSMTICIDSTWWPPTGKLAWSSAEPKNFYIPRHNLPVCFRVGTAGNSVREIHGSDDSRPSEFSLSQNYPNPFNPTTNIKFDLPRAAYVKLDVFNIVGQRVRTLVNEEMEPGRYVADWDGKDEKGNLVSSGIYFYRMNAGDFSDMKKMLLVK